MNRISGSRRRAGRELALPEIRKAPLVWALVADDRMARVFSRHGGDISLVAEIAPAENESIEFTNKSLGRMGSSAGGAIHHKYEPHMNQSQKNELAFVREIAAWLEREAAKGAFERLALIAPPQMLGHLRKAISPHVYAYVVAEVSKDYTKIHELKLRDELKKILEFQH